MFLGCTWHNVRNRTGSHYTCDSWPIVMNSHHLCVQVLFQQKSAWRDSACPLLSPPPKQMQTIINHNLQQPCMRQAVATLGFIGLSSHSPPRQHLPPLCCPTQRLRPYYIQSKATPFDLLSAHTTLRALSSATSSRNRSSQVPTTKTLWPPPSSTFKKKGRKKTWREQ